MICAIHQPQYMPWLGYFDKMDTADVFCFLDTVQFKKNEWQNRNRIKTPQGWQWLTVPVIHDFGQAIRDVRINDRVAWARKHVAALAAAYGKAPAYGRYKDVLEQVLCGSWTHLSALSTAVARTLAEALGITTPTVMASQFTAADHPTQRLVDLCLAVGADTYLSGADGARYMDLDLFARHGMKVVFQDFRHPVYPQRFGEFVPAMAAVDLLFNCGDQSLAVLRQGRG